MKMKQNEAKNEQVSAKPKLKRTRKVRTFFLYIEGNGFIRGDENGYPTFDSNYELMKFTERKQAVFASKFFKSFIKSGEIAIFVNVA